MNLQKVIDAAAWQQYDVAQADADHALNEDHRKVLLALGAGEGFIGREFVRLYRATEVAKINRDYEIGSYLPGLTIVATNGCGEAYGYFENSVVKVPFVPFDAEYVDRVAPSLGELLLSFAESPALYAPNPETFEREVDQIQPICLGGSPTDPANRAAFTREKHAEFTSFWNKTYQIVKAKSSGAPN